ncbi:Vesicle transport protein USE1 [Pseudolycoriella hygida]|uniref:Vesicle transport protein USE1 n=1 Tax=Pseudolycoriella hygida TaxID=35572 RepID=A0A9Q0N4N9_9DIPT|nr:Vesicle transport protein USE1 [Pseudolycoriella hygida]KAJ6642579.1 Vesicle transport protein USE1 [Pseudolycoriella hygida]
MSSKLEINIRTLLSHCEVLAKEDGKSWTLRKYIKSLDTMIKELATSEGKPSRTTLDEYYNRCEKLKTETNYVEQSNDSRKLQHQSRNLEAVDSVLKEIDQIRNERYHSQTRKHLLETQNELQTGLRKRGISTNSSDDMGQAIKYYGNMQEKIAEDMLSLTRSLKEQTEIANKIIRKDTETVSKSSLLSDNNLSSLASEADKLQEHSKRAWKCWMWIMIGIVMMIFIFMVLFMKITKKKL